MAIKVNEPSPEVGEMNEDFTLIGDLMGGTKAMRKAGQRYLPKRTMEEPNDHLARLLNATLFPAYKETMVKMTGRVFQEKMIVSADDANGIEWIVGSEDESSELEDFNDDDQCVCDDMDKQGRSIHVFARDVFKTGLAYGLTHVFIDSPPAVKKDGTPIVSMADQQAAPEVRPYAIHIHPRRILGWIQSEHGTLLQLRLTGVRNVREDFGETKIEQIWVYDLIGTNKDGVTGSAVQFRAFEKAADGQWAVAETRMMDIDHIPLVTFYTNRTGFMCAEPLLLELAYLNVKHWQKQSDMDDLMHVVSCPILVSYGGGDATILIGKSAVKMPPKPEADLQYCEHSGKAIEAGHKDISELKNEMRDAGAKLLQPGPQLTNAKTATQVNEEAAADNSVLGATVMDFEDFMDNVLLEFASWRGLKQGGTVECQPNLDPDMSPIDSLKLMLDFSIANKLSDETLYEELQKRGLINPDRPWKDELKRINSQPENQLPPPRAKVPAPNPVVTIPNAGDA